MIEKISWRGWNDVYRIWNDTVQVLVLADVGPRIIWYGFEKGDNVLHEVAADIGLSGGDEFRLYGGHRLWVSPEVKRTYFPDNRAVHVEQHGDRALFTAPVEDTPPGTNLQKQLEVQMDENGSGVQLKHCVINLDRDATELAPWTPTMMRAGGRAILPLPPRAAMDTEHYLSVGPLTLWSFTDLADRRWRFGTEFIQLAQSTAPAARFEEQMTGIFNPSGWGAYFTNATLFVKRAPVVAGATYPDFGCNFEVFSNREFLELETLGPEVLLNPGEQVAHEERWQLFENVAAGEDEDWIRSVVLPLVRQES
ncbi:MAG TPA: hypothetical protein VMT53_11500 [Terriglobales bacterium]|nr:hypothetical protein [Terriglobales bacterium]